VDLNADAQYHNFKLAGEKYQNIQCSLTPT
jgi:hypothetical protein